MNVELCTTEEKTMTVNGLLGKIEERIKWYGTLSMDILRFEYSGADTKNQARIASLGLSRCELIADLIVEEFSLEFDVEIESHELPPAA